MDFAGRLEKLRHELRERNIDAFLAAQNVDIFYFTGTMQNGYLWVPANEEPMLFVRRSVSRARQESACRVMELGSLRGWGEELARHSPGVFRSAAPVIAAEFDVLPVQIWERLKSALPQANWTDGSRLVRELRMIKDAEEIRLIREAARIVDAAMAKALGELREGMTELELQASIEREVRINGHMGFMRMRAFNQELVTGFVVSGEAAAVPTAFDGPAGGRGLGAASPQGASRKPIRRGEPILLDVGCCIGGYVIDQTRTAVIGRLPEHLARAYETAERILRETEKRLRPGVVCEELYLDSLKMAEEAGLGGHYMGYGADQVKFLGHGIGLEVDEYPVLAKGFRYPLAPGMVIAVEPKFTFPGEGVVGIENSYAITENGFEKLNVTREGIIEL